jgi:hypothetical protein
MQSIMRQYKSLVPMLMTWMVLAVPFIVGAQASQGLVNPIRVSSVEEMLVILLNLVIIIATPIVVLFIILAGFNYVTARGNPAKIQEATQALTYAIIGGVLIIGAVAIAEIIKNLVEAF